MADKAEKKPLLAVKSSRVTSALIALRPLMLTKECTAAPLTRSFQAKPWLSRV